MIQESKFFRGCFAVICLLTIILLISKVNFIFIPLVTFMSIMIVPITITVFLYYILRPLVRLADQRGINRVVVILVIYLLFAGLLTLFLLMVWPTLRLQTTEFLENLPQLVAGIQAQLIELQNNPYMSKLTSGNPELTQKITDFVNVLIESITNYMTNFFSFLSSVFIIVGTVPIFLYYLLKQDKSVSPTLANMFPVRYRNDAKEVLKELDTALGGFISGRMLSSLFLAILFLIGYMLIGLPYSLLLASVGALLNLIPYFGALLGSIPTVIIAFIESPTIAFWAIVIIIIAQQIEGNIISPYIYGKTINIHPVTTIVLLLIAGDFAGILGMLLCIPVYVMAKIVIVRLYKLFAAQKVEEIVE